MNSSEAMAARAADDAKVSKVDTANGGFGADAAYAKDAREHDGERERDVLQRQTASLRRAGPTTLRPLHQLREVRAFVVHFDVLEVIHVHLRRLHGGHRVRRAAAASGGAAGGTAGGSGPVPCCCSRRH